MARLALIAAVARNGIIGRDNRLPWRLPGDLKFFKRTTMGKPMIMGRKTWLSLGGVPLPGRRSIVLTHDPDYRADGALVADNLGAALAEGQRIATQAGVPEVMVIGGERLFAETLPMADRIYLTEVEAEPEGDACFPRFTRDDWAETELERVPPADQETPGYRIVQLDRVS